MIFASSSLDHLDCFFAGDSDTSEDVESIDRLAGMILGPDVVFKGFEELDWATTAEGAESERAKDRLRDSEVLSLSRCSASSSFGFRRREISTVEVWCQDWPQGCEVFERLG